MKKIFFQSEYLKIGSFLLIFLSILIFFNLPPANNINKLFNLLKAEQATLTQQSNQGHNFANSLLDYQKFNEQIPDFKSVFSTAGQELVLITDLEKIAKNNHLKQELNLSESKTNFNENIESLGLNIKLAGSFADLLAYLQELEKIKYRLSVDSVSLIKSENDKGLEIQLLLNTYWLK
ncbi:MAG: type 4a pilus biogenesis protein PilO [Patescibacteria group bacterium]|jgi:Tfp pilus assembly protein PilO